jgi:hypothetical protein
MHKDVAAIMARFRDRGDNPAIRPGGARPVSLLWSSSVAPGIKSE